MTKATIGIDAKNDGFSVVPGVCGVCGDRTIVFKSYNVPLMTVCTDNSDHTKIDVAYYSQTTNNHQNIVAQFDSTYEDRLRLQRAIDRYTSRTGTKSECELLDEINSFENEGGNNG